jgi:4a-hydroxytetrahydrobiopterin dehydratase
MGEADQSGKPLDQRECVPCRGGVPPLKGAAVRKLLVQLGGDWRAVNKHRLEKRFSFKDFREALEFTNQVGNLAEQVNHHPDLYLGWGVVKVSLSTHKIHGLSEADFVLAARVEALYRKQAQTGEGPPAGTGTR